MPDGAKPTPGGWNGIQLQVSDIKAAAAHLRAEGVKFRRDDIVSEPGGSQIWVARPFGNLVEPFQPKQLKDMRRDTCGATDLWRLCFEDREYVPTQFHDADPDYAGRSELVGAPGSGARDGGCLF